MKTKRFLAGLLVTVLLCSGAVSSINAAPNEELQNVLTLNEEQFKGSDDSGDAEAGVVDDETGGGAGEIGTGEKEWYWQVDWNGTGGWTFDGFTPWQGEEATDKLIAWSEEGIEATFSYTVTDIPNGIYTIENTISVKKNMTAVMGLQSGKADNDVCSEEFHTNDQVERRRLGNTIKVTNHKVTIYYSLKAEADPDGATFKLGNVELYRVGELENAVNVWKWDFAKADRRAEGWTLNASSGADPWIIEKDNENENDFGLQIWHETAYTGEYSCTIKNIQNGIYTLGNDIRVKSGMEKAVIRLESGANSVESENIDTDDKQVKDYRLGDTIRVTDHEVTIRYLIEDSVGGHIFAVNNITLYFVGSVKDIDDKGFVNLNGSGKTIREPDKVEESSYAPYNNLQILNNMEGAKVEVIGTGIGVKEFYTVAAETEHDAYAGVVDDCFVRGDFFGDSWSADTEDHTLEVGIHESMYKSMRAGEGDKEYGGISFLFDGSNQDLDPEAYQWKFHSGWKSEDLDFDTTRMWVKLNYMNVGYYKGRLINAHATIRVTPAKNRNMAAQGDNEISNGYRGVYEPMLQVSGSLYRGWVWQNVEAFSMDLAFYYSDENPEVTGYITLGEGNMEQNYGADNADYYVINSLNPEFNTNKKTAWNEEIPHYFGSEYVLPQHEIARTYIVDSYTKDGKSYNSNIGTSYTTKDADGTEWTQHAYNGGSNPWGGEYKDSNDVIGAPGWSQNSIMIMPEESTSLKFYVGQLARYPDTADEYHNELSRRATAMMWATISTTPFTRERQKINIEIAKTWDQISVKGLSKIKSVKFELWLEGTKVDGSEYHGEYIAETAVEADKEGNWKGTFGGVPQLEDLRNLKGLISGTAKYVVKECSVTYSDGTVENVTDTMKYEVSGTLEISSTTADSTTTDDKYDINESFVVKNKLLIGSVTVHKVGNSGESLEGVEFTLQKANVNGDTWELDSGSERQIGITDADGVCVFDELEEGNYLLTETETLQDYILLKEPVRITIPYELDGKIYVDLTCTITNTKKQKVNRVIYVQAGKDTTPYMPGDLTITKATLISDQTDAPSAVPNTENPAQLDIKAPSPNQKYVYEMEGTTDSGSQSLASGSTLTVYSYQATQKVYVFDYGLKSDLTEINDNHDGLFQDGVFFNKEAQNTTDYKTSATLGAISDNGETPQTDITADPDGVIIREDGSADGSVTFEPKGFMSQVENYRYTANIAKTNTVFNAGNPETGTVVNGTIQVMPASVVYYEDNFNAGTNTDDSSRKILYTGNHTPEGTSLDLVQSNGQIEQYGHDNAYNITENQQDSGGSSTKLTADGYNTKAIFTFTGTGFDILARTTTKTAGIIYTIEKQDQTTGKYSLARMGAVDTLYTNGALYQLPVIHEEGMAYGTYRVTLGIKQTGNVLTTTDENGNVISTVDTTKRIVYLDGIRIYNPLGENGDQAYIASEQDAVVSEIPGLIVGDGTITETGIVEKDENGKSTTIINSQVISGAKAVIASYSSDDHTLSALGTTQVEVSTELSSGNSESVLTYLNAGPNNELYLDESAALAFVVKAADSANTANTLQIEAKLVDTQSSGGSVKSNGLDLRVLSKENGAVKEKTIDTIKSSTAMYYRIPVEDCISLNNGYFLVVLLGNSDDASGDTHALSFSNLKYKDYTLESPYTTSADGVGEYLEADQEKSSAFVSVNLKGGLKKNAWQSFNDHSVTLTGNVFGIQAPKFVMYYINAAGARVPLTVTAQKIENDDTTYRLRFKTPNARGNFPVEIHYVIKDAEGNEEESSDYISTVMKVAK